MNHKWSKEFQTADCMKGIYRQTCERCGFVRGIHYRKTGKYYFVPNGSASQAIPKCKGYKYKWGETHYINTEDDYGEGNIAESGRKMDCKKCKKVMLVLPY